MQTDVRETWIVRDRISREKIQALLEVAADYEAGTHDVVRMREDELMNRHNLFSRMMQLRAAGYIALIWEPDRNELGYLRLAHLALTPTGRTLLADLTRRRSRERWKLRWQLLRWVAATSIIAALATLCARGAGP